MNHAIFADNALLPAGWCRNVLLGWDGQGRLTQVQANAPTPPTGTVVAAGPLIPGMPNLHSHAFQRALAGLTEYRGQAQDSFWSWRTVMYRFAGRLTPGQLEVIAFALYVEMLEAGYTAVCEFHYVHHDTDGQPYANDATMALALLRAAQRAGIGFTLLPVLYQAGGFGGQSASVDQRRFIRSTESVLRLLEHLQPLCEAQGARLGLAPHSLRAVPPQALREALTGLDAIDATAPVHIHIAEQSLEVDACIAWSGQRPVAWLLDHADVDERWCLVHATHMDASEHATAAARGAVTGLCPTTEANLGDGIFDLQAWRAAHGLWGIGSDSHICVSAAEELLMLEYSQRLATRQRIVGATEAQPHVASALTLAAVQGGAQASGRPIGGLAVGQQADFVMLDADHPALLELAATDMLSAHVFASNRSSAVRAVWVGGRPLVASGRHHLHHNALAGFAAARKELLIP
jgi:formimidoylglutamate deiminase